MKLEVLFVGFERLRVRHIVSAVEAVSSLTLDFVCVSGSAPSGRLEAGGFQTVFLSKGLKERRLVKLLEDMHESNPEVPVVLVYGSEPDGMAFLYANRYDCLLFSEQDRFNRTLTARELAEVLQERISDNEIARKLMGLSVLYGPCSTGN